MGCSLGSRAGSTCSRIGRRQSRDHPLVGSEGATRTASAFEMKPVVVTPAAHAELEGATEWYEARAAGSD